MTEEEHGRAHDVVECAASGDAKKEGMLLRAAYWAFDKAVAGVPGTESAAELAGRYSKKPGSLSERIDDLIRWQAARTGATGFAVSLGGIVSMSVAIPADFISLMFVQMRMIAAIAQLCGVTDMHDKRIRTLCVGCLAGEKILVALKDMGVVMGISTAHTALGAAVASQAALTQVHKTVGASLLARFSQQGAAHFGKAVPILGGVVGGGVNIAFTYGVGRAARKLFLPPSEDKSVVRP